MSGEKQVTGQSDSIWVRGFYMLLFALFYSVAEVVMAAVVLLQFGYRLFNGTSHPRVLSLGAALASYIYQVFRFLSFNTEEMPYPFGEWPQGEAAAPLLNGQNSAPRDEESR